MAFKNLFSAHFLLVRYSVLNVNGVRAVMTAPMGNNPSDKEKQDRTMAKAILAQLSLEKEKYRLGYTKVCPSALLDDASGQNCCGNSMKATCHSGLNREQKFPPPKKKNPKNSKNILQQNKSKYSAASKFWTF
jgi:hypothetical protein